MPRATRVVTAAERKDALVEAPLADTLILPHAQRQAKKGFLFGIKGTCVELDFAEPVRLRTDDALVLDDGGLIEVVAEPEPLAEVRAKDLPSLGAAGLASRRPARAGSGVRAQSSGSSAIRRSRRCSQVWARRSRSSRRRSSRRAELTSRSRTGIIITSTATIIIMITVMRKATPMRTMIIITAMTSISTITIITTAIRTTTSAAEAGGWSGSRTRSS